MLQYPAVSEIRYSYYFVKFLPLSALTCVMDVHFIPRTYTWVGVAGKDEHLLWTDDELWWHDGNRSLC